MYKYSFKRELSKNIKRPKINHSFTIKSRDRISLANKKYNFNYTPTSKIENMRLTKENIEMLDKENMRFNKVISGLYSMEKEQQYKENYITALKQIGASDDMIKAIEDIDISKLTEQGLSLSDMLFSMKYWYPSKSTGGKVVVAYEDNASKEVWDKLQLSRDDIFYEIQRDIDLMVDAGIIDIKESIKI